MQHIALSARLLPNMKVKAQSWSESYSSNMMLTFLVLLGLIWLHCDHTVLEEIKTIKAAIDSTTMNDSTWQQ